jgi:chemotaxis-related protein WspB
MKALVFHIGTDCYGLALGQVVRVLPAATLKAVPLAPPFVAGLLDLHGQPVPVIDVSVLAGQARDAIRFDTRIILVDYRLPDGAPRPLGLLADHVSGIQSLDEATLLEAGVSGAPFLGRVAPLADGLLQLVALEDLLRPEVRELLYQPDRRGDLLPEGTPS